MMALWILLGIIVGAEGTILYYARRGNEAARMQAQLEERDRRVSELQAGLAGRDEELRAASAERQELAAALAARKAELDALRRESEEKLALLNDARQKLEQSFQALAAQTLKANSESFLQVARAQMETLVRQEDGNLEKRREAIEKLISPVSDMLKQYREELAKAEKERTGAYAGLSDHVGKLASAHDLLRKETLNLVNALRLPQTRGRWGELTLKRVAEMAGMAEYCDFTEQTTINAEEKRLRPDMIVHLPSGHQIVVDSKVSLEAYLDAQGEALSEEERKKRLLQHANQVRAHVEKLASKEYARHLPAAPDFTVLFLPGEAFFSEAVRNDGQLIEDAMRRKVIIATPTTLITLLLTVACGWREKKVEENSKEIQKTAAELYERFVVAFGYFAGLGAALTTTVKRYNEAVGSVSARLLPSLQRARELGVSSREIPEISEVEAIARELPELPQVTPRALEQEENE